MIGIIDALLFVKGEIGITIKDIIGVLNINEIEALKVIEELKLKYDQENSGIKLIKFNNTYKLVTKEYVYPYLQNYFDDASNNKLSQTALEVLAIIYYHDKAISIREINEIRGVSSRELVIKLKNLGLIEESYKELRTIYYQVTEEFYDFFGIEDKNDLDT